MPRTHAANLPAGRSNTTRIDREPGRDNSRPGSLGALMRQLQRWVVDWLLEEWLLVEEPRLEDEDEEEDERLLLDFLRQ